MPFIHTRSCALLSIVAVPVRRPSPTSRRCASPARAADSLAFASLIRIRAKSPLQSTGLPSLVLRYSQEWRRQGALPQCHRTPPAASSHSATPLAPCGVRMSCFDDDVIVCVCTAGPDIGADFRVQHMLTFGVSYGGLLHPMTAMP